MSAVILPIRAVALPCRNSDRLSRPSDFRFSRNTPIAARPVSTKIARDAPRLSASIPTAPVPAYKIGEDRAFDARREDVEQALRANDPASDVRPDPARLLSRRLRNSPPITRMLSPDLHQSVAPLPVVADELDRACADRSPSGGCATNAAASLRAISRISASRRMLPICSAGQPGLPRAEELARPAQLHVHLGDIEAVVRFHQRADALASPLGSASPVTRMQ